MTVLRHDWRRAPWKMRYHHGAVAASHLRRLLIVATHRHCRVEFQGPVLIGPGFSLSIPDCGTFVVGPGVEFRRGFVCEIAGDGRVEIGANTTFTYNAVIQCSTSIIIGAQCVFAQSALIVDGSHRFRDYSKLLPEQGYNFRPITIGRGAAVMAKATIVANVGERAFIGANAVVTKDIPPYCLAVGVPARVVEYYGPPESRPIGLDG